MIYPRGRCHLPSFHPIKITKDKSVTQLRNLIGRFVKKWGWSQPMKGVLFIWDACVTKPTTTPREFPPFQSWPPCSLAPPLKKKDHVAFIMQIHFPSSCLHQKCLTHAGCMALTKDWQQKKEPQPYGRTQKPPDIWSPMRVSVQVNKHEGQTRNFLTIPSKPTLYRFLAPLSQST